MPARKHNRLGYKFYVTGPGCIESGWEYREDAADRIKEIRSESFSAAALPSERARVLTGATLRQMGMDPASNSSWCWQDPDGSMRRR